MDYKFKNNYNPNNYINKEFNKIMLNINYDYNNINNNKCYKEIYYYIHNSLTYLYNMFNYNLLYKSNTSKNKILIYHMNNIINKFNKYNKPINKLILMEEFTNDKLFELIKIINNKINEFYNILLNY